MSAKKRNNLHKGRCPECFEECDIEASGKIIRHRCIVGSPYNGVKCLFCEEWFKKKKDGEPHKHNCIPESPFNKSLESASAGHRSKGTPIQCPECDRWFSENKNGTPHGHKCNKGSPNNIRPSPEISAVTDSFKDLSIGSKQEGSAKITSPESLTGATKVLHDVPLADSREPTKMEDADMIINSELTLLDSTSFTYKGNDISYDWEEYGFQMYCQGGDLPTQANEYQIDIGLILSRSFTFPEPWRLVSGLYFIDCPIKFTKPATIRIQHCMAESNLNNLFFITSSDERPPYHFKLVKGKFDSDFGQISSQTFCPYGIVSDSPPACYLVYLYNKKMSARIWDLHFFAVQKLDIYEKKVKEDAEQMERSGRKCLCFEKEANEILLKPEIKKEIKIVPGVHPGIHRNAIDTYDGQLDPPSCNMRVVVNSTFNSSHGNLQIYLEGLQKPYNYITFMWHEPESEPELLSDYAEGDSKLKEQGTKFEFSKKLIFGDEFELKGSGKLLNGTGIRMAIIDFKGRITEDTKHIIQKISPQIKNIKVYGDKSGKKPEDRKYKEHAFRSIVIATGDNIAIAAGSKCDTYPGGIASGADVDVYLVDKKKRETTEKALNDIVNGNYDVLSVSIGSNFNSDPVWNEALKKLEATVVIAAGGNSGSDFRPSPSSHPSVIAVGSISPTGMKSYFSPRDLHVYCYGEVRVLNSDLTIADGRGTSLAAPAIAGLVCLILQNMKSQKYFKELLIRKISVTQLIRDILKEMFPHRSDKEIGNRVMLNLRSLSGDIEAYLRDINCQCRSEFKKKTTENSE